MSAVIKLLSDLVAIPSVNPIDTGEIDGLFGEARMVDHLEAFCAAHRLDCARQECLPGRDNLLIHLEGRQPGPGLLLEAHTDTVAVANMRIEPFRPEIRDGKLYGRGACDCKASLAAMLVAFCQVKDRGIPPYAVTLLCAADEEHSFCGVRAALAAGLPARAAMVGEPTSLNVIIAHKGALRLKLIARGTAAHTSEPDCGENAIYAMAETIAAIQEYAHTLAQRLAHPLLGGPTACISIIHGGSAINIVPDRCEAHLDRRLLPAEDWHQVEAEIADFIATRVATPIERELIIADPGMEVAPDAPITLRAVAAAEAALGHATIRGAKYGTDASKLVEAGIPSVVCGPGDIAQAHTDNEWVDLQQVEGSVRLYEQFIASETPLA